MDGDERVRKGLLETMGGKGRKHRAESVRVEEDGEEGENREFRD